MAKYNACDEMSVITAAINLMKNDSTLTTQEATALAISEMVKKRIDKLTKEGNSAVLGEKQHNPGWGTVYLSSGLPMSTYVPDEKTLDPARPIYGCPKEDTRPVEKKPEKEEKPVRSWWCCCRKSLTR